MGGVAPCRHLHARKGRRSDLRCWCTVWSRPTSNPRRARARAIRAELGIAPDETVLTTVANLRDQKDYPTLRRAARIVLDRTSDVTFLAVGQGPLQDAIAQLHQELGLGKGFRLLGYRADVPEILAGSDAFVLASKYEGYPIAVMEALTIGLPVVSTDVGGVPETVAEGVEGFLVPSGDPEALAAALLRMVSDPATRARMGAAAAAAGSVSTSSPRSRSRSACTWSSAHTDGPGPRNSVIVASLCARHRAPVEHLTQCPREDPQIECERRMVHVPDVQPEPLVPVDGVPPVHLGPARDAGWHLQPASLLG